MHINTKYFIDHMYIVWGFSLKLDPNIRTLLEQSYTLPVPTLCLFDTHQHHSKCNN